ncbi:MAG: aldehyde dehydrogenase family protein [Saprospiraceae bacterium]
MITADSPTSTKNDSIKMDTYIKNFIGGSFLEPSSGNYLENPNPATGKTFSYIPDSQQDDVELAVAAAQKAFPSWSKAGVEFRYKVLNRIAELIGENLEEFALAESMDSGKPLSLARTVDIPRAQSNFRFFATAILHFSSESHNMEGQAINYTGCQLFVLPGDVFLLNLFLCIFLVGKSPRLWLQGIACYRKTIGNYTYDFILAFQSL